MDKEGIAVDYYNVTFLKYDWIPSNAKDLHKLLLWFSNLLSVCNEAIKLMPPNSSQAVSKGQWFEKWFLFEEEEDNGRKVLLLHVSANEYETFTSVERKK